MDGHGQYAAMRPRPLYEARRRGENHDDIRVLQIKSQFDMWRGESESSHYPYIALSTICRTRKQEL